MDSKNLRFIILPHGIEQPSADPTAVILCVNEEICNVLRFSHTENSDQLAAVKGSIEAQSAGALPVVQTGVETLFIL